MRILTVLFVLAFISNVFSAETVVAAADTSPSLYERAKSASCSAASYVADKGKAAGSYVADKGEAAGSYVADKASSASTAAWRATQDRVYITALAVAVMADRKGALTAFVEEQKRQEKEATETKVASK